MNPPDLVGVGFGPSNLALAVAVDEHNRARPTVALGAVFLERQQRFGWHRGMLIEGTTMQVSFLKDLVTLRNPTSEFSFVAYLHDQGRLIDFINHKSLFPSRVEFHDYLEWVAERFAAAVEYGTEVLDVRPVLDEGVLTAFDVVTAHDTRRTRNVVLATGLQRHLPDDATPSDRIWHNEDLLTRLAELEPAAARRFVVVGAGQSAAETTEYLHRTFADAQVCAVFARYGYTPSDDSAFANRIFDAEAVDSFYAAPETVKQMLMSYHANTNYSVVDPDLIEELYRRLYQEKVLGRERLRIVKASRVVHARPHDSAHDRGLRVTVEYLPTGETEVLDADVLVYATGYRADDPLRRFPGLDPLCTRDDRGRVRVERDYRVATVADGPAGIYLQGPTEHTHGITSTLLSHTAERVGDILASVLHRSADRPPALVGPR